MHAGRGVLTDGIRARVRDRAEHMMRVLVQERPRLVLIVL